MSAPLSMFPAHAGMNREWGIFMSGFSYVPRTRGDEPAARLYEVGTARCSPHTRG